MMRSRIGRIRVECQRCGRWAEASVHRVRSGGVDIGLVGGFKRCRCGRRGADVARLDVTAFAPKSPHRTNWWNGMLWFRMPHAPKPHQKKRRSA